MAAALLGLVVACGGGGGTDPGRVSLSDAEMWSCSGADVSALKNKVHVSAQDTTEPGCGSPTQTCTIQTGIDR